MDGVDVLSPVEIPVLFFLGSRYAYKIKKRDGIYISSLPLLHNDILKSALNLLARGEGDIITGK